MKQLPWKVGELARCTGLSVRALHHYEEIGLLRPALRSPAGHRLYEQQDVARLQQIQSLRILGLPLEEVRRLLEGSGVPPLRVLYLHLARLREQIARQTRLAESLKRLARHLESAETVSAEELCQTIEDMTTMEKYFTTDELAYLRAREEQTTPERLRQVGEEWAEIIPAVRTAMERGIDPASPEIQDLARRWMGLVEEFTGGNPQIEQSLRTLYTHEGPALEARLGNVPDPGMFEYISQALRAMKR